MSKKKRKKKKEKSLEIRPEVYGVFLILLSILSYGIGKPLGYIGKMARGFALFLFGSLDWLFIACVFFIGIYLLFRGKSPSFWSTKFNGLLLVTIGILAFANMDYIEKATAGVSGIYDETIKDITNDQRYKNMNLSKETIYENN